MYDERSEVEVVAVPGLRIETWVTRLKTTVFI
jgi:hypothetical protein